jgi:hypothetical protein
MVKRLREEKGVAKHYYSFSRGAPGIAPRRIAANEKQRAAIQRAWG